MMNRIIPFTAGFILVWLIGYLLIVGRGMLIPLVIALFLWNILNTLSNGFRKIPRLGLKLGPSLRMVLSFIVVVLLTWILLDIISNNVNEVILASSRYQENLMRLFNKIDQQYHVKILTSLDGLLKGLEVQTILGNIYAMFTTITGSAVLISLYVVFLFVEQHFFKQKFDALIKQPGHRHVVDSIISHIVKDIQTYLGLKTLMSLITGSASWVIMKSVGLDFAEFWAILIFFLNYIPNIGAIVATAFPALLALIQFQSWFPFVIVTGGVVVIQFMIGNLVEPRFLGKSLNLSPLVILLALAFWGAIWGVLGMFLSVPITVMMMIIFAHFDTTRPIAIMLSQDGYIKRNYE